MVTWRRQADDPGKNGQNGQNERRGPDDATEAEEYKRGQKKPWPTDPSYREYDRGLYRVDYDWLTAQLAEMAGALDVPPAAHALAPHLAEVRLDRAREAIAQAEREGREPHPEAVAMVEKRDDQRTHAAASTINDIVRRNGRPEDVTLSDLAELARRLLLTESNALEWSRRGGRSPWAQPPGRWHLDDEAEGWGAMAAEVWRTAGIDDSEWERQIAGIRAQSQAAARERERRRREGRAQPGHANGTTGTPEI